MPLTPFPSDNASLKGDLINTETAMRNLGIAAAAILGVAAIIVPGKDLTAQERLLPHTLTTTAGFAQQLQSNGQFEMESSAAALQKSHNEDIRSFAQKMIDDHKAAADKLTETLKQANIAAPPYAIMAQERDLLFQLIALDGAAFDRRYVEDQVKGHKDTVDLLTNYAERGDNAALKQLASSLLPTIKDHLNAAERLRSNVTAQR